MIRSLTDLIKDNIQKLYPKQFKEVKDLLLDAYQRRENNSLILLSRSRYTVHSFLNKMTAEIQNHPLPKQSKGMALKVVRVNSILNNTESKILQKLHDALDLKGLNGNYTIEIFEQVKSYFEKEKNLCLIFILEDIDYYIESTKQIMLYKVLDMLQNCKIPFVFMATSQKVDIVDSFEKRIKSRFSQRLVLFYEEKLEDFILAVNNHFNENFWQKFKELEELVLQDSEHPLQFSIQEIKEANEFIQDILRSKQTRDFLQQSFETGK